MGLFLHVALFPGGDELRCRTALQRAADNQEMNIHLDGCRWHLYDKGPAVLLSDGCCGYEELSRALSATLSTPVMVLYIYDGDYWGYYLFHQGQELDQFAALPHYFEPGLPPDRPGNAPLVARCFGVEAARIEGYLAPWPQDPDGAGEAVCAYPHDFYAVGDEWQLTDLMKALGFDYDLLSPPPPPAAAPTPPPPAPAVSTPPHHSVFVTPDPPVHRPSGPLPDSEVLPDALTDRSYALRRGEEVLDVAAQAVEAVRAMTYQQALPLLTQAIQAHPDRAGLYILRSFCWNQLEGLAASMSRKPDMDRDLTRVLELEPENIMALRARCPTAATTSRYRRHIGDLTRLIELDGEHWDTYMTSRAYRHHWLGDDEAARADLRTLLEGRATMTVDLSYLCRELGLL